MTNAGGISGRLTSTHDHVAAAFDLLAIDYDEVFGRNTIIERLRNEIYATIDFFVRPPARILDINCGTGTDGLHLATLGYDVVGADLSLRMIAEANRKAQAHTNARFVNALYEDLSPLGAARFDLVLSNFGGLNCTEDLGVVAGQVAAHLNPGGYFVAVIMPPFSLWETLAYAHRWQLRDAFRRLRPGGTETQFSGHRFTVHYFSRSRMRKAFADAFDIVEMYSLNVLSPPPHAWKIKAQYPRLTALLEKIDRALSHLPLFRAVGDHTVYVLRRRTQ
ncbi:MAG TPA: class I SAM-dependent methyltransferase [Bacteroidota bacterium]|nr:class I SAM-dependent methyltransferase [Bacteroidota bacterium]